MSNICLKWLLFTLSCCDAAKILSIIPFPMKSHDIVYKPLLIELARRGHNVTTIGPYSMNKNLIDENASQNYREIIYESDYKDFFQNLDFYEIRSDTTLLNLGWWDLFLFWDLTFHISEDIYRNPKVKQIIENSKNEKFDLIICEGFFGFESTFAFGELFESPVIAVATFGTTLYMNQHIGNPMGMSYYPNFLLPYTDKMNLIQRLHNFVLNVYILVNTYIFHIPNHENLVRKYFNHAINPRKISPLPNMLSEVSLVFLNSHVALGFPRPNLPNVIDVGGLHIQRLTNKTLDKALQKLMDNATQGIIYFSLGSNVNIAKMPKKYIMAFIKSFSKLPQLVLWKWDDTTYPGQTENVRVSGWFPQQQILAHENCVAFITHGGMLSLEEAVYNGVPVIGIPFFGDQTMNMKHVEEINYGIMLDYDNITYESLSWSLNEIIKNKRYKETAKRLSSIFRDSNDGGPLERAVYWIEYVLKYNGAPHLRTAARLLPWYKYLLLDIILILILLVSIVFYIIYKIFKSLLDTVHMIRNQGKKKKSE